MKATTNLNCPECGGIVSISVDDLARKRNRCCPAGHDFRVTDQAAGVGRRDEERPGHNKLKKIRKL